MVPMSPKRLKQTCVPLLTWVLKFEFENILVEHGFLLSVCILCIIFVSTGPLHSIL